jgi:glycosyltransferase involved in cell wall biosynthesis
MSLLHYSVVIPAYNAEKTIVAAIDSIMNQRNSPKEIIVVDDGSTDGTCQIVSSYAPHIRLVSQANQGCGSATTHGINLVKDGLIAFLDADDVWLQHKMEVQLETLSQHPEYGAVLSHVQEFNDEGNSELNSYGMWGRSTLVIKQEDATRIGEVIDPPGRLGDMIDWIKRGQELGIVFHMIPQVLSMRRIRKDSLSYGADGDKLKGYVFVAKRALDRMREKKT